VPGVFLRRPFSIYGVRGSRIEFLYRVVGKGTETLSQLKAGSAITLLGPLGAGYDLARVKKGVTPLLVAGGTGIASLSFLAERLPVAGILFYGARQKKDLVGVERFKKMGWEISIATEDGSQGLRGFVTDACGSHVAGPVCGKIVLYSCGPHPMLRKVAAIARTHGIEGYVSLEEMMACGVGNCQGCAVSISGTYKMVCKDGPVFNINDVDW
jgi:dihydroorotate dehydrogenase electron transfer subunit